MHQANQPSDTTVASGRKRSALSSSTTASTVSHGRNPFTAAILSQRDRGRLIVDRRTAGEHSMNDLTRPLNWRKVWLP